MATYKGIQGYTVQKLATDPTAEDTVGQLWYNSTAGKFKISTEGAGAWASGGALNTATYNMTGIGATQSAVLSATGATPPATPQTEIYDGTTWTVSPATVGTAGEKRGGAGTTAAGLMVSGLYPGGYTADTESWSGSAWSQVADVNSARRAQMTNGTQTAALLAGGYDGSSQALVESWNGSTWTETTNINTSRYDGTAAGITTAFLCIGGYAPSPGAVVGYTELWNGSTWTEVGDLNDLASGRGASGTSTATLVFGGDSGTVALTTATESYNGTAWTEVGNLATGRYGGAPSGTSPSTSALYAGGTDQTPTKQTVTEEWSDPSYTIKTVTVS